MKARVRARANIALIKYWGKADAELNIPAVGSISVTLDRLWSDTEVEFSDDLSGDEFLLDGASRPDQLARTSSTLDLVRELAGAHLPAKVTSENNFPTGAGLASSASGFAALTAAAAHALGLQLTDRELSLLARRGSGSAARSIFGGYVEMHAGSAADGGDSYAEPLLDAGEWPLTVVIAITGRGEKPVGSRAGMAASAATSPYYPAWVATSAADLDLGRRAILEKDFSALGRVAERSCLKMHAAAMANEPPLLYWNPATLACMQAVEQLQADETPVFFTIDAGPQVKAICTLDAAPAVVTALRDVPGVIDVIESGLGPGLESL
ncbi:MAG: diphosphomevalonate decarboxylase [Gammaproteobacteria bacterium]